MVSQKSFKNRTGDKIFAAVCVFMFLVGSYLAVFQVWGVAVVPDYQWIKNLLGLGCMFGWVFLSLYSLFTGKFNDVHGLVILALFLICGFIASIQALISLLAIAPLRCESTTPDILICEENLGDMAVYQIQPDGIFMHYIDVPRPVSQTR